VFNIRGGGRSVETELKLSLLLKHRIGLFFGDEHSQSGTALLYSIQGF